MTQHELPVRPQPYGRLLTLYSLCIAYGATAIIGYIPSILVAYGRLGAIIWPLLLILTASGSILGLVLSRTTQHYGIEIAATLVFCALLFCLAVAILIRGIVLGDIEGSASFFLPLLVIVEPFARLTDLVRTPRVPKVKK